MASIKLIPNIGRLLGRRCRNFRVLGTRIDEKVDYSRNFSSLAQNDASIIKQSRYVVKTNNLVVKRYKKSKKASSKGTESDGEDEEDDDDLTNENPMLVDDILGSNEGTATEDIVVASLRFDSFSKVAFRTTRTKIEELFYKGDLYLNGERPPKKSCDISEGDEIDVVKQINPEDHKKIDIKRIQVLKLPDKASEHGRLKVKISKAVDLTIDHPDHRKVE